ncbi:uncharacterized protein [Chelonus insularis]|uniref:uncharacterized protein n=1 Tax=Chelonus insularis TaxID=460826 RepID=UPI00158B8774|nr:uncharacterized protein LOC118064293 [Chelonus insularis]
MAAGEETLAINRGVVFDESISHCELHAYQPYASASLNNNDEIRIAVQHQDLCSLPCKSSLHITGKFTKTNDTAVASTTKLVNMALCYLFEEIRYELNGIEIDRNKNVGLTNNTGWIVNDEKLMDNKGYFDILLPLNMLLGFAEDYHRIIVNARHELVLTRSNTDLNAIVQAAASTDEKITLTKIEWMIPYITVSDPRKIQLLNYIAKDPPITVSFRSWETYEYPLLPRTTKNVWMVKTSTQLEKPRYVILAFQTARKNDATKNSSQFDHCNLRNVKLFLNSQCYPYGNLNLDIAHNQYALLYDMYKNFQESYYGKDSEPLLTKEQFIGKAPLIVIDCSKQNESLKSGPVDVRIEFESTKPIPDNTSAYCLIIHDRIVEYKPLSGQLRKLL